MCAYAAHGLVGAHDSPHRIEKKAEMGRQDRMLTLIYLSTVLM